MEKSGRLSISTDSPGFFLANASTVHDPFRAVPKRKKEMIPIAVAVEGKRAGGEVDFFSDKAVWADVTLGRGTHTEVAEENFARDVNTGLQLLISNTGSDQSSVDEGRRTDPEEIKTENELRMLRAEVERVNEENRRLRDMFLQVTNDYRNLQLQVASLRQHQIHLSPNGIDREQKSGGEELVKVVDHKMVGLGGRSTTVRQFLEPAHASYDAAADTEETLQSSFGDRSATPIYTKMEVVSNERVSMHTDRDHVREESLELGCANNKQSSSSSHQTAQKSVDQEAAEATMRKARVSVRARSEAPMITDGCQWRKYGQKMAKGNPCPRAYYRCTMAAGCPVRKQVQRCAEDRSILITTYEGTQNHPLPPAAMPMASITSSTACMLLSGSMPSADGLVNPGFLARTILPCSSSLATISASAPFPTVTLDLTQNTNPLVFQRPNSAVPFSTLPFGNAPQPVAATPSVQSLAQSLYNQSKFSGLQLSGGGSSHHEASVSGQLGHQQPPNTASLVETVSAITADPNFTSALAAAITSIIGSQQNKNNQTNTNMNNGDGS